MKDQILKIAGVKSEKEFYSKYPTEEAFQKAHGKEFKKAKLGAAMVPEAQSGFMAGHGSVHDHRPMTEFNGRVVAISDLNKMREKHIKDPKPISPWEDLSNINNYTSDRGEQKALKKEYEGIKDKYKGLTLNQYVAAKRDADRTSVLLGNNERYGKYFDESGKVLPNTDLRNIDPNLRFYKEKFPKQSKLSAEDVLGTWNSIEGGFPSYEGYVNEGYRKPLKTPMKEGGQLHKLQQLTDFGNPPIADMGMTMNSPIGSYMNSGGQEEKARNTFLSNYVKQQQAQAAQAQAQAQAAAQQSGGGGGMGDIGSMVGNFSKMFGKGSAKKGKNIPKNQNAPITLSGNPTGGFDWTMGSGDITGQSAGIPTLPGGNAQGMFDISSQTGYVAGATPISGMAGGASGGGGFMNMIGGAQGAGNIIGSVIGGIQQIGALKKQKKTAKTAADVAKVVNQAARLPQEQITRKYLRPEDSITDANQRFPTYGVGTNYLSRNGSMIKAEDGSMIGGNPTEIQNTYNPGDLYSGLGYEPLNDSNQVKQYRIGGFTPRAEDGYNAGSQLSSFINDVGGSKNPISAAVNFGMFAIKDNLKRSISNFQNQAKDLNQSTAFMNAGQGLHGQYSQFMENGGWMSHDWQPQVISQFDGHPIKSLLTKDPMMDTLRTGGHISQNNMFPQDQYALGGELKTTWGGYAEPISHNPKMPGTGETVMFKGLSKNVGAHSQSDGNGHTGIGVKYGQGEHDSYTDYAEYGTEQADADVEVEKGEPALEMIDPQTGEKNMVVYGNLMINKGAAQEIGDPKAAGKKYKNYVAGLAKIENKQNKIIEKSTNSILNNNDTTASGMLKRYSNQMMQLGANMKLKDIATKKTNASIVQNATNETAEEHGIDADAFARGKIKIDKEARKEMAKYGKEIEKAQLGKYVTSLGLPSIDPNVIARGLEDAQQWLGGVGEDIKKGVGSAYDWSKDKISNINPTSLISPVAAIGNYYSQKAAPVTPVVTATPSSNGLISATQLLTGQNYTEPISTPDVELPTDTQIDTPTTKKQKPSGYVSKYGIEPWQGNKYGLGKKTKSSFTAEEWDKIADKLGFKGKGNKEFEEFLLNNPEAKTIIEKRHQDLYKKAPWIDPKHFGYGWAAPELKDITEEYDGEIPLVDINLPEEPGDVPTTAKETTKPVEANKRNKLMDFANQILPYLRPSDQEPFDQSQLYPELYALASNKVEPVQAQLYNPELDTPYDISLQDQMNANQSDFNAIQRQSGYAPEAAATLAAQKYAANSKILGEQFRMNQAMKAGVYDKNRQTLNDAKLKNLGILDQQFVRQETAKSKTRDVAQAALNSMADKIAKNKLENRTLGVYENMYNYRFDKNGRAQNWNGLTQFDTSVGGATARGAGLPNLGEDWEWDTTPRPKKKKSDDTDKTRNGSLVKAIKNL